VKDMDATRLWLWSTGGAGTAIFVAGILRAGGKIGAGTLFVAFGLAMIGLLYLAFRTRHATPRLNLTLAAESVVALGIFSLIVSILAALVGVADLMVDISKREIAMEDVKRFAWPFVEGLAAAAVAPVIATMMRHIETHVGTVDSGDASMAEAAREATVLASELKKAVSNIKKLNAELEGTDKTFEGALGGAVRAAGAFSSSLQTETDRLKLALQRVQAEATGLADASEKSRVRVTELGKSVGDLASASNDARELLDALGKLIDSVERYIKPA